MNTLKNDLTGLRFTNLTVKHRVNYRWLCVCDCGEERLVGSTDLIKQKQKSCGCLKSSPNYRKIPNGKQDNP